MICNQVNKIVVVACCPLIQMDETNSFNCQYKVVAQNTRNTIFVIKNEEIMDSIHPIEVIGVWDLAYYPSSTQHWYVETESQTTATIPLLGSLRGMYECFFYVSFRVLRGEVYGVKEQGWPLNATQIWTDLNNKFSQTTLDEVCLNHMSVLSLPTA